MTKKSAAAATASEEKPRTVKVLDTQAEGGTPKELEVDVYEARALVTDASGRYVYAPAEGA